MKTNFTKLILLLTTIIVAQTSFGQASFTSNASGNWSDATKWTLVSGSDADGIPDSDDDATIAASQTITLDADNACNNLTLQTTTGANIDLATFTLQIGGTLAGPSTSFSNNIITCATGKIKFIGNGRALFGSNWAATTTALRFEVALNAGQVGTASTNVKAKEIIITTGSFDLGTGELRPDDGVANGGKVTIETGGLLKCLRLSRTSTVNTPFSSLIMNGNAKLQLNSTASSTSNYLPAVNAGFPVYTLASTSLIEYIGSSSGTISVIPYKNLAITLANSGSSRSFAAANTIDGNLAITTATVSGNSGTITINGNITINTDAILTFGSNAAIFNGAGAGNVLTVNNGGILEAVNRSLTLGAAGATTPLTTSYSGWETLTLNTGSTVSYAIPGGATACSQDVQTTYGGNPLNYQNLRVRMTSSTTGQSATHYIPIGVSVAGTFTILHAQGGSTAITTTHDVILVGTGTLSVPTLSVARNLANAGGVATSTFTLATSQDLSVSGNSTFNSSGIKFTAGSNVTFTGNVTTGNGTNAGSTGTIFNFNGQTPTINFNGDFTDNTSAITFSTIGTEVPLINFNNGTVSNPKIATTTGTNINLRGAVTVNGYRQITGTGKNFSTTNSSTAAYLLAVNGTLDLGANTSVAVNSGGGTNVLNGVGTIKFSGIYNSQINSYSSNDFQSTGTLHLNGTTNQDMAAGTYQNITVDNIVSVSLLGSTTINSMLSVKKGALITGSNNLTLGGSASVVVSPVGTLNISGGITDLANRPVTLQSSALGTGRVAEVLGTINNATAVTQERFVQGKSTRRWSFITSPVGQSLSSAWQQQIHITGTTAGIAGTPCPSLTQHDNGFDATISNAPNMYSYNASNASGSRWVANTIGTTSFTLTPGDGYRLNVRGPRSTGCSLLDGSITTTADVTLSATGALTSGSNLGNVSKTYNNNTANEWLLIGNPYPCELNFTAFQADAANSSIINPSYIIYDPANAPDAVTPANMYSTWNAGTWSNAATSISAANGQYIANGQAVFVQAQAASNITLTFKESHKYSTGSQNGVFRTTAPNWKEMIRVALIKNRVNIDQTVIRFANDKAVEKENIGIYDATLLSSSSSYLGSIKANRIMSIQTRPLPLAANDKINLDFNATQTGSYQLKFSDFETFVGYDIYLIDNFTNSRINIAQQNSYTFIVDKNIVASQGSKRFIIEIARSINTSLVQINSIKTYPNPANKQIAIELPQVNGYYTIKLVDLSGKVVLQQTSQGGVNYINLSKISKGSYVVEITDAEGNRSINKIAKQ